MPRRRRLCSHSAMIQRRELPWALGSGPMAPCTLVASTTSSRSSRGEGLAHDVLGLAARVDVGGVDEVDPGVERAVDDPDRVVVVGVAPGAEHHRPEAQRADLYAGASECAVVHGRSVPAGRRGPSGRSDLGPLPLAGDRVLVTGGGAEGPGPAPRRGLGTARRGAVPGRRPAAGASTSRWPPRRPAAATAASTRAPKRRASSPSSGVRGAPKRTVTGERRSPGRPGPRCPSRRPGRPGAAGRGLPAARGGCRGGRPGPPGGRCAGPGRRRRRGRAGSSRRASGRPRGR